MLEFVKCSNDFLLAALRDLFPASSQLLGTCWQYLGSLACRHVSPVSASVVTWPPPRIACICSFLISSPYKDAGHRI